MKNIFDHPALQSELRLLSSWTDARRIWDRIPGISVGIVHEGVLVWEKGFGYSDPEKEVPADSRTIYRVASISKLFTSTAVMQLRDAGKLDLDAPISEYLDWFDIKDRFLDSPPITLRHLMTHTSGLPREAAFYYWADFNFPTRDQIMETLPGQKTIFPRETRWKYSNLALALAGEVVAAVSGVSYEKYILNNILSPLNMNSTSVELSQEHKKRLARGYGRLYPEGKRREVPFTDAKGIAPAANISSTVEDLAKFIAFHMSDGKVNGQNILKKSTVREMQRIQWIEPDWKSGWGLGFSLRTDGKRTLAGHGGSIQGYRTQLTFCTDEKLGIIVLTNASNANPGMYVDKFFKLLSPVIEKIREERIEVPEPDPGWEKFCGKYRNDWCDGEVMIYNGELVMIDPGEENPEETIARFIPAGDQIFRLEADSGFMRIGEPVQFIMNPDNTVEKVNFGDTYMYPVQTWNERI